MQRVPEKETRTTEAAVARRFLSFTCLLEGDLTKAKAILEQALKAITKLVSTRDRLFDQLSCPINAAE